MIITLLISLAVVAGIVAIVSTMPTASKCNHNCNQGRNCTCKEQ